MERHTEWSLEEAAAVQHMHHLRPGTDSVSSTAFQHRGSIEVFFQPVADAAYLPSSFSAKRS